MNSFLENLYKRAIDANKRVVLAEGFDKRVVKAAEMATKLGLAKISLLGNPDEIKANNPDVDLEGVDIIDFAKGEKIQEYANVLYEIRKYKGMTEEQARYMVSSSPLYYGAVMVKVGDADGMVAGAVFSSGDVLRSALQVIKSAPGIKTVSSCFIMKLDDSFKYKKEDVMVFADCAVVPMPDAEQLSDIAIAASESAKNIAGIDPRIAMLSFSTRGSAKHEVVEKVQQATQKVREKAPYLVVDGDLQLDAAIVESVAKQKAGDSKVAGRANVLVFPNLEAGNIGYKIAQRFGNAEAYGPIMQGLDKPINDLSRGCIAEDVVSVIAITALQANK